MITFLTKILFLLAVTHSSWALPWFAPNNDAKPQSKKQTHPSINFSGLWIGQCNNSPAIDLTIKHEQNQFKISYGFMEEHYTLGEVKSQSSYKTSTSEHGNTVVNWNNEQTALLFINSNLFVDANLKTNVFFSEVTMYMEGDNLIVNGQHFQKNSEVEDFKKETLSCIYHQSNSLHHVQ